MKMPMATLLRMVSELLKNNNKLVYKNDTIWQKIAEMENGNISFHGFSFACRIFPLQPIYVPKMVVNSQSLPTNIPNLWVSAKTSFIIPEWIKLDWDIPTDIEGI